VFFYKKIIIIISNINVLDGETNNNMSKNTNLSFLTDYITADITNGRIGINNASPTVDFDVSGITKFSSSVTAGGATAIADVLLPIQINAVATTGQAYFASNNNGSYGLLMGYDNANGYARIRNVSNTALTFETNNTEKVRITSVGNVGIGNIGNSSRKLEVTQPTGYSAGIRIIAETGPGDAKIQFFGGGSSQMTIGPTAASPNDLIFSAGDTERMRIISTGGLLLGTTTSPTITGGSIIVLGDTIFCSGTFNVPSPYTQSLIIDIVWNNWGGNNVAAIVEVDIVAREWGNLGGIAFGKVYALSSAGAATFNNTVNTTNITSANGSFSLSSPANYTLRLNFTPTNNKDIMGYLIKIPASTAGTGTNIASITASLV